MVTAKRAINVNGDPDKPSSFTGTEVRAAAQNPNKTDDDPRRAIVRLKEAIVRLKELAKQQDDTVLSNPKAIKVGNTYVVISSSPPSIGIRETNWRRDVIFKKYIFDEEGECTRVIMLKDGEDTSTTRTRPNDTKEGEKFLLKPKLSPEIRILAQ